MISIFINLHFILRQFFLSFWNDRNRIHHQTVTWSINYPSFRGIVSPNNGIVYGYILFMLLIDSHIQNHVGKKFVGYRIYFAMVYQVKSG